MKQAKKNRIFVLLFAVLVMMGISVSVYGDHWIVVGGTINNGTWRSGYTYFVESSVTVTGKLVIEPGVVVKFGKDKWLAPSTTGTIEAVGEARSMIIFTSMHDDEHGMICPGSTGNPAKGNWECVTSNGDQGFKKDEIRQCRFEFCKFMYADSGLKINFPSSEPVQHNHFSECYKGVWFRASTDDKGSVTVFNNLITDCVQGVCAAESRELTVYIESNTIDTCSEYGIKVYDYGVDKALATNCLVSRCETGISGMNTEVSNCGFYDNNSNGLVGSSSVILSSNPYEQEYYLYQDCALIDAGYDPSNNGMPGFTTSVLETEDVPPLDIGYHYPRPVTLIWYVDCDVNRSHDGTSWNKAFKTINEAHDNELMEDGDEIWVAEGTYDLSTTGTIEVDKAVGTYGGFEGNETEREQRNPEAYITTTDSQGGLRAWFIDGADCVIDGFTIRDTGLGTAYNPGGGIVSFDPSSKLLVRACKLLVHDHYGVYWEGGELTVEDCDFESSSFGMYLESAQLTISNCNFSTNGIHCSSRYCSDSVLIEGCVFADSTTGGAVKIWECTNVQVAWCDFENNISNGSGAGIANTAGSITRVENCSFVNNSASLLNAPPYAGAIYNKGGSELTVVSCLFSSNFSFDSGGAIANFGGLSELEISTLKVINCTFHGNEVGSSGGRGGALHVGKYSDVTLKNCILWEDEATDDESGRDEIYVVEDCDCQVEVTYSNVELGYPGLNNSSNDPGLADPWAGDFHLTISSECRDSGIYDLDLGTYDLDGNLRIINGIVDRGAYEYQIE